MRLILLTIFSIIISTLIFAEENSTGSKSINLKGAYTVNDELYVSTLGNPEGNPITKGFHDR